MLLNIAADGRGIAQIVSMTVHDVMFIRNEQLFCSF